jgi:hypothetical protein
VQRLDRLAQERFGKFTCWMLDQGITTALWALDIPINSSRWTR